MFVSRQPEIRGIRDKKALGPHRPSLQYVSVRITRDGIRHTLPWALIWETGWRILPGRWRPLESFGSAVWAGYPALLKRLLTGDGPG